MTIHRNDEANAGRMKERLMAIVVAGDRTRVYLSPTSEAEAVARSAKPTYGSPMRRVVELGRAMPKDAGTDSGPSVTYFTPRQLVALTTFSNLVAEAMERESSRMPPTPICPMTRRPLRDGGTGATAYAEAVGVYLACGISRSADFWSNLCIWANQPKNELVTHLFGRQGIPMAWDYAEASPFSNSGATLRKT